MRWRISGEIPCATQLFNFFCKSALTLPSILSKPNRVTKTHHMNQEPETLEEMMQREIDDLRQEIVNLKNRLREVGELCRDFMPKEEDEE